MALTSRLLPLLFLLPPLLHVSIYSFRQLHTLCPIDPSILTARHPRASTLCNSCLHSRIFVFAYLVALVKLVCPKTTTLHASHNDPLSILLRASSPCTMLVEKTSPHTTSPLSTSSFHHVYNPPSSITNPYHPTHTEIGSPLSKSSLNHTYPPPSLPNPCPTQLRIASSLSKYSLNQAYNPPSITNPYPSQSSLPSSTTSYTNKPTPNCISSPGSTLAPTATSLPPTHGNIATSEIVPPTQGTEPSEWSSTSQIITIPLDTLDNETLNKRFTDFIQLKFAQMKREMLLETSHVHATTKEN